jgi:hypothetical protein
MNDKSFLVAHSSVLEPTSDNHQELMEEGRLRVCWFDSESVLVVCGSVLVCKCEYASLLVRMC